MQLKTSSVPALRSRLAASACFACLASLLPCLAWDYAHFSSYFYESWTAFLLSKALIWFALPFLYLLLLQSVRHRCPWCYLAGLWWAFFSILSYGGPTPAGALIAAWSAAMWWYIEPMFARLWRVVVPAFALLTVLLGVKGITFSDRQFSLPLVAEASARDSADPLPVLGGSSSLYLIVFDELAASVLYKDGTVRRRFPNFGRLAAMTPRVAQATTNYDLTEFSIPSLLAGRLAPEEPEHAALGQLVEPNLFDMASPGKLFVWGASGHYYCRSLSYKSIDERCRDFYELTATLPLLTKLRYDLQRFFYVFATNNSLRAISAALEYIPGAAAKAAALSARLTRIDLEWAHENEPLALGMALHRDFISTIGAVRGGVYFYHSRLPHFPYNVTPDLEEVDEDTLWSFSMAESDAEMQGLNAAYRRNIEAADRLLGEILDTIETRDPGAVLIVTSDHGVARSGRHALVRGTAPVMLKDVIDIPLFVRLPPGHRLHGSRVSDYQHIDLLPTICDAMNVSCPEDLPGSSLFDPAESAFSYQAGEKEFHRYEPLEEGRSGG